MLYAMNVPQPVRNELQVTKNNVKGGVIFVKNI